MATAGQRQVMGTPMLAVVCDAVPRPAPLPGSRRRPASPSRASLDWKAKGCSSEKRAPGHCVYSVAWIQRGTWIGGYCARETETAQTGETQSRRTPGISWRAAGVCARRTLDVHTVRRADTG